MKNSKDIDKRGNQFTDALLNGDNSVISTIYKLYFPKALSFIRQNSGSEAQAKDVFQDALMYIIMGLRERKLNISNFEAYLFTICKNKWRREVEKEKKWVIKEEYATLLDKDTDFAQFMLEQEQIDLYREKFNLLSDNCKEILALFFNDVPYEQIVKELSYATINTARQRIFKCKSKLVKMIKLEAKVESEAKFNKHTLV